MQLRYTKITLKGPHPQGLPQQSQEANVSAEAAVVVEVSSVEKSESLQPLLGTVTP